MENSEYIKNVENTDLKNVDLELKHVNTEWKNEYGLLKGILYINGKKTRNQLIFKNGEFVANVGSYHNIYPNELAEGLADTVASELDFQEYKSFEDKGKFTKTFLSTDEKNIEGEEVRTGFTVANSIDGSRALRVEGFTFRELCSNGVIMGKKQLVGVSKRHSKQFSVDPEKVKRSVELVLEKVERVLESYEILSQEKLNEKIADNLANSGIPQKIIPRSIEVESGNVLSFDNTISQWNVYNDMTKKIWHNEKTNLDSKRRYYDKVHNAMKVPRVK